MRFVLVNLRFKRLAFLDLIMCGINSSQMNNGGRNQNFVLLDFWVDFSCFNFFLYLHEKLNDLKFRFFF